MNLFSLHKGQVVTSPKALLLKQFKDVWDKDKSKDKKLASKELAYIYFLQDWASVYSNYAEEERHDILKVDLDLPEDWEVDHVVKEALKKYEELQQTPSMRYARSVNKAFWDMLEYFDKIDWDERDNRGQAVYKHSEVSKVMGESGKLMDTVKKLDDLVRKEKAEGRIKGGEELGLFQDPEREI